MVVVLLLQGHVCFVFPPRITFIVSGSDFFCAPIRSDKYRTINNLYLVGRSFYFSTISMINQGVELTADALVNALLIVQMICMISVQFTI